MSNFVICDDDPAICSALSAFLGEQYPRSRCTVFTNAYALTAFLSEEDVAADVLLVDIELGASNSIELIEKHRSPYSKYQIIYITGHIDYCTQVYDTPHSCFITKPFSPAALKKAVDRALASVAEAESERISVSAGGTLRLISPRELICGESHGRTITLTLYDGSVSFSGKLDDFCQKLDARFVRCHKSFFVNMDCVTEFRSDRFILRGGKTVPISQLSRKAVRECFLSFVQGGAL